MVCLGIAEKDTEQFLTKEAPHTVYQDGPASDHPPGETRYSVFRSVERKCASPTPSAVGRIVHTRSNRVERSSFRSLAGPAVPVDTQAVNAEDSLRIDDNAYNNAVPVIGSESQYALPRRGTDVFTYAPVTTCQRPCHYRQRSQVQDSVSERSPLPAGCRAASDDR